MNLHFRFLALPLTSLVGWPLNDGNCLKRAQSPTFDHNNLPPPLFFLFSSQLLSLLNFIHLTSEVQAQKWQEEDSY